MQEIIEKFVDDIHKTIGIDEYDFDIVKIIEGLGGTVVKEKVPVGEVAIVKSINKVGVSPLFTIAVSDIEEDKHIIRSSLAKALGHILIHLELLDEEAWNEHAANGKIELEDLDIDTYNIEANVFAILFLMPKDKFLKAVNKCIVDCRYDLEKLSDILNVSFNYAYNRGKSLGLWY